MNRLPRLVAGVALVATLAACGPDANRPITPPAPAVVTSTTPPAPTTPPSSSTSSAALPVVKAGAFCTPAGAQGVTSNGAPMVCTTSPTDSRNRWRAR